MALYSISKDEWNANQFGSYLKSLRKDIRKITVSTLAELAGVSQPYISQFENGKGVKPSFDVALKLANALEVEQTEFMKNAGYLFDTESDLDDLNMQEPSHLFAARLRILRKEKGLSINELSRMSGVSQSYLSQIENGRRGTPTFSVLVKLSSCLGITASEMKDFGRVDDEFINQMSYFSYTSELECHVCGRKLHFGDLKLSVETCGRCITNDEIIDNVNFLLSNLRSRVGSHSE